MTACAGGERYRIRSRRRLSSRRQDPDGGHNARADAAAIRLATPAAPSSCSFRQGAPSAPTSSGVSGAGDRSCCVSCRSFEPRADPMILAAGARRINQRQHADVVKPLLSRRRARALNDESTACRPAAASGAAGNAATRWRVALQELAHHAGDRPCVIQPAVVIAQQRLNFQIARKQLGHPQAHPRASALLINA